MFTECSLNVHCSHEYHLETLVNLRAACQQTGKLCGVLLDTKGPEIRTGTLKNSQAVQLVKGQRVTAINQPYLFIFVWDSVQFRIVSYSSVRGSAPLYGICERVVVKTFYLFKDLTYRFGYNFV